jgi:hypothetical protein
VATTINEICRLFGQFRKEYEAEDDWDTIAARSPRRREELLNALQRYEAEHSYPEPEFFDNASNFYYALGK